MDKNDRYKSLKAAAWITQFGINMITPIILFIIIALWLKEKFNLGDWIMILAIILGVGGAIGSMFSFIKTAGNGGGSGDKKDPD